MTCFTKGQENLGEQPFQDFATVQSFCRFFSPIYLKKNKQQKLCVMAKRPVELVCTRVRPQPNQHMGYHAF